MLERRTIVIAPLLQAKQRRRSYTRACVSQAVAILIAGWGGISVAMAERGTLAEHDTIAKSDTIGTVQEGSRPFEHGTPYAAAEVRIATIAPPETLAGADEPVCDAATVGAHWQRDIDDAALDSVIATALRDNIALKEQNARLAQAQARSRVEGAARGPQADAHVRYDRRDPLSRSDARWRSDRAEFRSGLSVTQDLDLWGRLRDKQRVANLQESQARWERDDTQRRLVQDVTKTYWELGYLMENGGWLLAIQDITRRRLSIMEARYRSGDARLDEVMATRADAHQRQIEWTLLAARINKTAFALARLTGETPGVMDRLVVIRQRPRGLPSRMAGETATLPPMTERYAAARLPGALPDIPEGVSAAQLQCRADIRASAAALSAFAAEASAVRKDWYPYISLTAGLNTGSPSLLSLMNAPIAMLAGMIKLPFLNPGQRYRVREAEARYTLAETRYLRQWQTALREVADALAERQQTSVARSNAYERQIALIKAESVVALRYRAGEIAAVSWLDKREERIRVEMDLLAARRDEAVSAIQLFQSLGSGSATIAASG